MSSISCEHACATICLRGLEIANYVEDYLKKECQTMVYFGSMTRIVTHDMPTVDEDGTIHDRLGNIILALATLATKIRSGRSKK